MLAKAKPRMSYYADNAVYQRLRSMGRHPFSWTSGNAWSLVYGDRNAVPKAIVFAAGVSWERQDAMVSLSRRIAEKSGVPFLNFRFDERSPEVSSFLVSKREDGFSEVAAADLKGLFEDLGVPVSAGGVRKAVNDAASSAYHRWQRANLGQIVVSDIDLFRKKSIDARRS